MGEPAGRTNQQKGLLQRLGGEAAIERMLRDFYARAREDELLGKVFNVRVDDWEYHIQKVVVYWRLQTRDKPAYQRTFPSKHAPLGLREKHFRAWLALFQATAADHFAPEAATAIFDIARKVAANLFQDVVKKGDPPAF